ncbi:MAG: hypothetical protein QW699_00255 [Metallosphaera sp.]|uniref:hypothetical protein n=1 Tax=Saccharolobus sp. TaxID=2100761 RepID=UPI0031641837
MKIVIPYKEIEKNVECVKEFGEYYPYADNLEYEFSINNAKIDYTDLEDIVDEYLNDIIEILIKYHRKELEKALQKKEVIRK